MTATADHVMTDHAPPPNQQAPALDTGRRRLALPRDLVPASLLLLDPLAADRESVAGLSRLERAGITNNGRLHGVARGILEPLACPAAVLSIEVLSGTELSIATIWTSPSGASIGRSDDGMIFVLEPIDRGLIPFHIAALTELAIRPTPTERPLTVDMKDFRDMRGATGAPADAGAATAESTRLGELLRAEVRRWRVTTLWSEPDGFIGDCAIQILDAGDLGYWQITDVPRRHATLLTPRSTDDVLRLLSDLDPAR